MLSTKENLAAALSEAGAPAAMIDNAKKGVYDDYESDSPTPINDLVRDARAVGLHDIAERAINGEFDATREESDAWWQREGKHLLKGAD